MQYAPHVYAEKEQRIEVWAREAERTCPQNPARELADYLDVDAVDSYNVAYARDLARWAGASHVGKTRRDAIEALASAWIRFRALRRSAAISPRCAQRCHAAELRRRAYASRRSVDDQRDHERHEHEIAGAARRAEDRRYSRSVIGRGVIGRGHSWWWSP